MVGNWVGSSFGNTTLDRALYAWPRHDKKLDLDKVGSHNAALDLDRARTTA